MNALQYSYNYVMNTQIPKMVLDLAFPQQQGSYLSMEDRMYTRCIKPIILADMNILGGVLTYIPLANCGIIADQGHYNTSMIIDVPKTLTGGRSIVRVHSLVMGEPLGSTSLYTPQCTSPIVADTSRLYATQAPSNVIQTSRLELVGENKILVEGYPPHTVMGMLKVEIENNTNLENVQPSYYPIVAKLITLGVKMYVYNTLRPQLDIGHLYAGHEIPFVKDAVDSYSDAHELYREALQEWTKISILNDSRKRSQVISTMIGMMA